jgi:hypothetical protein
MPARKQVGKSCPQSSGIIEIVCEKLLEGEPPRKLIETEHAGDPAAAFTFWLERLWS